MDPHVNQPHQNPTVDPKKLSAELYPTPLTYDEKLAERREARRIRLSHRPKRPKLLALAIIAGLIFGILMLIMIFPSMFTGLGGLCMGILFIIGMYVAVTVGIPKARELADLDTDDE